MNSIGPLTELENGTQVQVNNKRGIIVDCKVEQAHPAGLIVVHTIEFNQKIKVLTANRHKWETIKPETKRINYASIHVL